MLKAALGTVADTGDVRLGDTVCRGWLSMPNADDDWQRRWVVLSFATSLLGLRNQAPNDELLEAGSVAFFENEKEREQDRIAPEVFKGFRCKDLLRAYQVSGLCRRAAATGSPHAGSRCLCSTLRSTIDRLLCCTQPNAQEMKMNNMFTVVLPDRVIRFQAQSTNAVRVWLSAFCSHRLWPK